jgi:flagellin-like protein
MKGVSAIISTVLILGIAVSLAGVYATWAPNIAENVTREVTPSSENDLKCGNAAISIQDAAFDQSGEVTLFDLRNSGTIRFDEEIIVRALNNTRTLNNTTVPNLAVEETVSTNIPTDGKPERLIALTDQCPSVRAEETIIGTQ